MINLEEFLNNNLESDVMDVFIYLLDGTTLTDAKYQDYVVVNVRYEQKQDGKYCFIDVDYK